MLLKLSALVISVSSVLGAAVCAQGGDTNRLFNANASPVVRSWTTHDGLPQNNVSDIDQTPDGYLWLGTRDGLARFDGIKFTLVALEEGLAMVNIRSIFTDRTGVLWVASSAGGVHRLVDGKFQSLKNELGVPQVLSMTDDESGRLWLGTQSGVCVLRDGKLETIAALDELTNSAVRCLATDPVGDIWIDSSVRGLLRYHNGKLFPCPGPEEYKKIVGYSLLADKQGRIWVGVEGGRLLCLKNNQCQIYGETNRLPSSYIAALIEDASGNIWAGSLDSGLYRFDGERFQALRTTEGLSADDIRSLFSDHEGNLWVGTRTGGLNQLLRRKMLFAGKELGLTNSYTRGVAETPDGNLWVAASGSGLYCGNLEGFHPFQSEAIAPYLKYVETLLVASDGSLWCGSADCLLRLKDGKVMNLFTNEPWVRKCFITSLKEDEQGGLWIGNSLGTLVHYQNGIFTIAARSTGSVITSLAVESGGAVWVGSVASDLLRFSKDLKEVLEITNGLPSQSIQSLYLDGDGVLWIGTAGGGLSCWQNGSVKTFTADQGFTARTVLQIVEDNHGDLWLGCRAGVCRAHKQDLLDCAASKIPFVHVRSYGANDGLQNEECAAGFSPSGLRLKSGLICISTVKGLAFFDPDEPRDNLPPPQALIETISINGHSQTFPASTTIGTNRLQSEKIIIPPGDRKLEIQYTAIRFSAPEKIGFRYRLHGADDKWIEVGTRRTAYFEGLSPGNYSFDVDACDPEGHWNGQSAIMSLIVQPFLWETIWFRAAAILAAVVFLWLLIRRRYKIRLAKLQMINAIERERLRISKDMHDQVGGTLTQVSQLTDMALGETNDEAAITSRLDQIGKRARAAVQSLDEIVWATNPKNDNLASFAEYFCRFATEFLDYSNIRCRRDLPVALPMLPLRADIRHNIFLAAREACNNVVKHSKATEVWIRLSLNGNEVVLEIQDNGCGFAPEQIALGSNGIENMRARLAEDGGQTDITSKPGEGTTVRFKFKFKT